MKKKVYIAGKVTGLNPDIVSSKFQNAEIQVELLGFEAVNPIKVVNNITEPWESAMKICVKAMLECDAVVILPCWSLSTGARIERQLAAALGIPIFNYDSFGLKFHILNQCNN